jgi:hypothetical protein
MKNKKIANNSTITEAGEKKYKHSFGTPRIFFVRLKNIKSSVINLATNFLF